MSKTLKATLILTCMVASLQALAMNGEFSIRTSKIGDQIIGKSPDGQFFTVNCRSKWSWGLDGVYTYPVGDITFPNSLGDIVKEITRAEPERSQSLPLTKMAANGICNHPYADVNLKVVQESGVTRVDLRSPGSYKVLEAPEREALVDGQTLSLRTGLIDNHEDLVAAVTNDDHFYVIACGRGVVRASSADLIYPNAAGKIILKNPNGMSYDNYAFGCPGTAETASYAPLSKAAVQEICNHPNGLYNLQVKGDVARSCVTVTSGNQVLEYVGGQNFEANARQNGRNF